MNKINSVRIVRERYLQKVIPFVDNDVIKVLIGQRRVGKSYMLLQLMDYIKQEFTKPNIVYLNKELPKFTSIKNADDLIVYVQSKYKKETANFLFIDEVQDIEHFEIALRGLYAEKQYDIYCTGSNAKMLSKDIANYLGGRYVEFTIHSLSYDEFLEFHQLEESQNTFNKYLRYGGMPYLHHIALKDEIVFEYLKSIYNTIVLRDIVERYGVRNIRFLEQLNLFLADNLGSLLSAKRISDFLKSQNISISPRVVLDYLQYLENVFFIEKAPRYDVKGRKVFEINDKFYFTDLGLRNTLYPFSVKDIGKVLENVVYNKLKIEGFDVFVGKCDDKEIDFVGIKGDVTVYVQVAYLIADEKVHKREFGNLLQVADNHRKMVVSMDGITENYKGVEHLNIRDFCLATL